MYVMLATVHGAFSLSLNVHAQNIGTQKLLTVIVKRARKRQYWVKRDFRIKMKNVFPGINRISYPSCVLGLSFVCYYLS